MIREIAQNLIDNPDADEAINFIREHGDPATSERLASMAMSSFTEKKINQELARIRDEYVEKEPTKVDIKIDASQISNTEQLQSLIKHRNELVAKRDHIKGQLELIPTDEQRLEAALQILSIGKELHNTWQDINTLNSGQALPVESDLSELDEIFEGVTDVLKLEKIRKNHVTYRSKARKGDRPKEKIPFYEKVIREAERRINAV